MGHLRLLSLPDNVPWRRVVASLAEGADVSAVAAETIKAAERGLNLAKSDVGLGRCVYLLAQIVLAARQPDFIFSLRAIGLRVSDQPSVFDLTDAFTQDVDRHLRERRARTDISEIAQLAAVQSLTHLLTQRSATLFGTTTHEVKNATYSLSTPAGFGILFHDFFARFAHRFLRYHLERELPHHVGGNGRFADPTEQNEFVNRLEVHTREATLVVKEYAADWYSKATFTGGITPAKANRFANHCVRKLRDKLMFSGGGNV